MERVALRLANGSGDGLRLAGGSLPIESRGVRLALPVTVAAICALGLAGHGLLLAVLLAHARRGRSSLAHGLLASLGAADLLLLLLCAPLRAAAWSRPSWQLGRLACRASDWLLHGCLAARALSGAALAWAGLAHVSRSPRASPARRWRLAALLLGLWALAFSLPAPRWVYSGLLLQAHGRRLCVAHPPPGGSFAAVYAQLYPLLAYGAPVLCSLSFHCRALRRWRPRHSGTPAAGAAHPKLRNQRRGRRLVALSGSLSLAFAALCAPEWAAWLWLRLRPAAPPVALALPAQLLLFVLAALDPLLFAALSGEFREEYPALWKRLASCRGCRRSIPGPRECRGSGDPRQPPDPHPRPRQEEKSVQVPEPDQESPASKPANLVLTDMEQFWHDRQNTPAAAQEDPIPWEHQGETPCPEM
ncbi:G-protein coupled receptor 151 [Chiloscyllium plagiosum]|uniref:G-protein coupled receptor 151 n=1 Tax=Chiloscyllium plagiosum TaxID=36176 RepID=UPI001CB81943|nr:G-protein coupled receptor 151 [Chiloscyllium plagiosum]